MRYIVKIKGSVTKSIIVDADNKEKATETAHQEFSTGVSSDEKYEEECLSVEEAS